jgi:nicotinamidase-related amidase
MDYQPAVLASLADADALLSRAAEAVATVRRSGGTVGYVRVAFDDADLAAIPPTAAMAAAVARLGADLHVDSEVSEIDERVAPGPEDITVRKTRVGAFSTTDLDDQLLARGIDTLILAGVSTSGVVLSTVRDAADRDYRLFVVEDLCRDRDPEVHRLLLDRVFPRQARVISQQDLAGLLGDGAVAP